MEAIPLWKLFPREIEAGLETYYPGREIGQWHTGEISSRKLLVLVDGFPSDSWYRMRAERWVKDMKEEEERRYRLDVSGLIYAQLSGQTVEGGEV